MKRLFIYLILQLIFLNLFPQENTFKNDSLQKLYYRAKSDSERIYIINNYAEGLMNSDQDEAIRLYSYAYTMAIQAQCENCKALALNGLGLIYYFKGMYSESLDNLYKAIDIAERCKNNLMLSRLYNNVGNIQKELKDYDAAILYYQKSLKIKEELKEFESYANTLNNIGTIYKSLGDLEKSRECYQNSLLISEKYNYKKGVANAYQNLGVLSFKKGNVDEAIAYFEKCKKIREEINDKIGISQILYNTGFILMKSKRIPQALQKFFESIRVAREMGDRSMIRNNYQAISELYADISNYKLAYDFLVKYVDINDSIIGDEVRKSIAEMQTKFETARKEKEIHRLNEEKLKNEIELEKKTNEVKFQRNLLISIVAGMLIILFFSVAVFRLYKQKAAANKILEEQKTKIAQQNEELLQQKEEILAQRDEIEKKNEILQQVNKVIEHKNKLLTDSISYARRIQEAIFPPLGLKDKLLPDSFVLFKPKDIVSGDFYWIDETESSIYFAVVDCTGHGVPGAFMSIVGYTALNQALHEKKIETPAEILDFLNQKVVSTLRQSDSPESVKDGMELCLCRILKNENVLEFAGARNPLVRVNDKGLLEYRTSPVSVGIQTEENFRFKNFSMHLNNGDCFYIFSDGFADQFGGPERKKFLKKNFFEILKKIHSLPMEEQKKHLNKVFDEWKGNIEQYDDVLVLGVRINS